MIIKVSNREHATILAALRCFQQHLNLNGGEPGQDFAGHFEDVKCLDDNQIDTFCERINCAEVKSGKRKNRS